jgi:hypothetical protein
MPSSVRSLKRPYDPVLSSTAPQVLLQSSDCRGGGIRVMAQPGPQIASLDELGDQFLRTPVSNDIALSRSIPTNDLEA